ncbi:hypothetical protein AO70_04043 [Mycobacterium tuberculosis M2010]|nr:hypothetical protein AO70_04043 [Mycobacterium tuberculosis M2010]
MMVVLKVSVPSRGFGSDDYRVRWSLIGSPSFRPLSG